MCFSSPFLTFKDEKQGIGITIKEPQLDQEKRKLISTITVVYIRLLMTNLIRIRIIIQSIQ